MHVLSIVNIYIVIKSSLPSDLMERMRRRKVTKIFDIFLRTNFNLLPKKQRKPCLLDKWRIQFDPSHSSNDDFITNSSSSNIQMIEK